MSMTTYSGPIGKCPWCNRLVALGLHSVEKCAKGEYDDKN